ncbi:MAG: HAD family hydrolase [Gammaproteobacteria bacterium]
MANRSYDAVLFDLGNTLVSYYKPHDFHPILKRSMAAIGAVVGEHGGSLDVDAAFEHAKTLNRERDDGRVWPLAERLSALIGETGVPSQQSMKKLIDAFLEPIFSTAQVDPQAIAVLEQLRASGLKTAIVSNTPWGSPAEQWRGELDRLGLLDRVDEVVFCVDVGWRKPSPQPFQRAMSLLRVSAARTVFVGDDVRWDVVGARRVGIEPILISNGTVHEEGLKTIRELDELMPLIAPI